FGTRKRCGDAKHARYFFRSKVAAKPDGDWAVIRDRRSAGLPVYGGLVLGMLLFAAVCIAAPLAVYTVTLAAFGLPHVLNELRYVDRRFGLRVSRTLLWRILPLLLVIAASRAALVFHLVPAKI